MSEAPKVKRFYKEVAVARLADGFAIHLDGRPVKTRDRSQVLAPTEGLALAVAEEWRAQGEYIEQLSMPLAGLLSTAIDADENAVSQWRADIFAYLGTDLLCYRADSPNELMRRQAERWDPYLDWFEAAFGARLKITSGLSAIEQPEGARAAIEPIVAGCSAIEILALRTATAITGSAVLGLAAHLGVKNADELFSASRLDEDFQAEKWGVDEEAAARTAIISEEFRIVCQLIDLCRRA